MLPYKVHWGPAIGLDEIYCEGAKALQMHGGEGAPLHIHGRSVTTSRAAAAMKGGAGRILPPLKLHMPGAGRAPCRPCGAGWQYPQFTQAHDPATA